MRYLVFVVLFAAGLARPDPVAGQITVVAADAPSRTIPVSIVVTTGSGAAALAPHIRAGLQRDFRGWFRIAAPGEEPRIVATVLGLFYEEARVSLRLPDLFETTLRHDSKACALSIAPNTQACDSLAREFLDDIYYVVVALQRAASRGAAGRDLWTGTPATAPAPPVTSPPASRRAEPCDPEPPPAKDPGIDVAFVNVARATLRTAADPLAAPVRDLPCRSLLVLVSREKTANGWYNVVDADSSDDGWIAAADVGVHFTALPREAPFQQTKVGGDAPPKVTVTNDTDRELSLTVGEQRYRIAPKGNLEITISAGTHKYIASAPGVLPLAGTDKWDAGTLYTWRFYIATR